MNRNTDLGTQRPARESEVFFRQWLRSPKSMGSIVPSSKWLARAIAAEVAWRPGQVIVELGGGTGAITSGLLDAGIPPEALVFIELDPPLYRYLRERFPDVRVVEGDATRLGAILSELDIRDVGTVVSGLPMIQMPLDFQRAIMEESFRVLPPAGFVLQYSFSPLMPVRADQLDIAGKRILVVVRNLPPAFVWRFQPRDRAGGSGRRNGGVSPR
jgi:phosphatidylethanolamine/phosphatidyl-N-methylethanolamine N-methyltransferase